MFARIKVNKLLNSVCSKQLILDEFIYFHEAKIKATIHASANSINASFS